MGIREKLNESPRLTGSIVAAIIVATLAFAIWNLGGASSPTGQQIFFTVDDGKTWFADGAGKVPPFKRDGKDAVRAYVFRCDGKTFVNHMERYTPGAKRKLEALQAGGPDVDADPAALTALQRTGLEVKSPGTGTWVGMDDPKAAEVLKPKCSNPRAIEVLTPDS